MKSLIRKILQEERNGVTLVKDANEPSALEKEFNIKLTERYEEYNFEELLAGKVIYLNFIRTNKQGLLRDIIEELKETLKKDYDFIVLEVAGHDYNLFKTLKQKYENVGFIGIMPDNIGEYDLGLTPEIDPYEEDVFMYTKIR